MEDNEIIKLKSSDPGRFYRVTLLPQRGPDPAKCRGCAKLIRFARTSSGKTIPISQMGDGSWVAHFYDCPKADEFRKPKS